MEILSIYTNKKNKNTQFYMRVNTRFFKTIKITKSAYLELRYNLINEGFKVIPCKNECEKIEK